jgi:hypothetical protein
MSASELASVLADGAIPPTNTIPNDAAAAAVVITSSEISIWKISSTTSDDDLLLVISFDTVPVGRPFESENDFLREPVSDHVYVSKRSELVVVIVREPTVPVMVADSDITLVIVELTVAVVVNDARSVTLQLTRWVGVGVLDSEPNVEDFSSDGEAVTVPFPNDSVTDSEGTVGDVRRVCERLAALTVSDSVNEGAALSEGEDEKAAETETDCVRRSDGVRERVSAECVHDGPLPVGVAVGDSVSDPISDALCHDIVRSSVVDGVDVDVTADEVERVVDRLQHEELNVELASRLSLRVSELTIVRESRLADGSLLHDALRDLLGMREKVVRENRVADFVGIAVEVISAPGVDVFVPPVSVAVIDSELLFVGVRKKGVSDVGDGDGNADSDFVLLPAEVVGDIVLDVEAVREVEIDDEVEMLDVVLFVFVAPLTAATHDVGNTARQATTARAVFQIIRIAFNCWK